MLQRCDRITVFANLPAHRVDDAAWPYKMYVRMHSIRSLPSPIQLRSPGSSEEFRAFCSMSNKVQVYVYDQSNGLAKQLSRMLTGKQIDGVWFVVNLSV